MADKIQKFEDEIGNDRETLKSLKSSTMQYLQATVNKSGKVELSVADPGEWNELQDTMQALLTRITRRSEVLAQIKKLAPQGYNNLCYAIPNVESVKRDGDLKVMAAEVRLSANPNNREKDIQLNPELIALRAFWAKQYEQALATYNKWQPIREKVDALLKDCA